MDTDSAPGNRSEYGYPSSGENYGQSFLCISVDANQFDMIGRQLMYNQIVVYRRNIPDEFVQSYSVLADAAKQKRIRKPPFLSKVALRSSGSVDFLSFAKSDKWQKGKRLTLRDITYDNLCVYSLELVTFSRNDKCVSEHTLRSLKIN